MKAAMRASYKLEAKDGMARQRKLADWLEQESPAAANSLREALEECFTINRLAIPSPLQRWPGHNQRDRESAVGGAHANPPSLPLARRRHGRPWATASFLSTERNFRRIMGWKDLS